MSKPEENKFEKDLDCSNANRGVWLVKVPKYIAKKWERGNFMKYFVYDSLLFTNFKD